MAHDKDKSTSGNPESIRRASRAKVLHEAIQRLGLRVADVARGAGVQPEVIRGLAHRGSHEETLDRVSMYIEAVARERLGRLRASGRRGARQASGETD